MPVKDHDRWKENPDGSWSRRLAIPIEASVKATAAATMHAAALGVDLATVTGTGKDGIITKPDVEAAASD